MKTEYEVSGVKVRNFGVPNLTEKEMARYVEYCKARIKTPLKEITLKICEDGKIDLSYLATDVKFERIRRITGYLVGTTDRWNDAKQSEERERVKHQ